ncbi:MAG: diguanylate cyclase [Bdellovibrionales bacterium]|nr:diguanylate cyclase [Bdellovibrionales bacterium]
MSPVDNKKRKILVVDDDETSRSLVSKALEYEGYQVRQAESGLVALKVIEDWTPHLILLDVNMPGLNGLETLAKLRVKDEYVSVMFVSANSKTEDVIRGLDAGADDYVCKPFEVLELLSRVRSQLRIKDLHDSLKKANDRLKELVDIDDLTGLFNMRSLYKRLDFELDRARRYNRSVCVIMMDLDHFKRVNDQHDHLFGSYVIGDVGRMIRENIRKVDFAARYGGDEFLVVLTEIALEGAVTFANRLRGKIEESTFKNEFYEMDLTASLGLAITNPNHVDVDARSLVRYADRALYNAKEKGRNRVEVFDFGTVK